MGYNYCFHSFAKINLFLKVDGKREDGYHDIETVFQTVSLKDRIEVEFGGKGIVLETDRKDVPSGKENLILKAIDLLKKEGYAIPGMKIKLRKTIPPGSGLGGGSSNAAVMLMGMNRYLDLRMSSQKMADCAQKLGSDVTFFLWGGTAAGRGRGNEIFPLPSLPDLWITLATFEKKIHTSDAYSKIDSLLTDNENNNTISKFIYSIFQGKPDFSFAENDFERLVLRKDSKLRQVRRIFQQRGSMSTLLTGSGSAFYGLFKEKKDAEEAASAVRKLGFCGRCTVCSTIDSVSYHKRLFGQTNQE